MQKDYQQIFNERYDAALEEVMFPKENWADGFLDWLHVAIQHHTEFSLQCSWSTYESIYSKVSRAAAERGGIVVAMNFTLLEMCNAMNAVEFCTWHQLRDNPTTCSYLQIKGAVKAMAAKWNEIAEPIKVSINEEVQKEYEADVAAAQANKKIIKTTSPLPKKTLAFPKR